MHRNRRTSAFQTCGEKPSLIAGSYARVHQRERSLQFPPHSTSTESENGEVSTFLLGVVILAVVLVVGFVVMTRK